MQSESSRSVHTGGLAFSTGKLSSSSPSKRTHTVTSRGSSCKLTPEIVAGAYPLPPGVSSTEIMNIRFSPPQLVASKLKSKYLSFLAPGNYPCRNSGSDLENLQERKLCVLDLQTFWEYIESLTTDPKAQRIKLPTTHHEHMAFAKYHVQPLLCPTMTHMNVIHHRYKGPRCKSPQRTSSVQSSSKADIHSLDSSVSSTPTTSSSSCNQSPSPQSNSGHSTTALNNSSSTHSLSLQERLRRERQRITISPHGMTQFSWTSCTNSSSPSNLCRHPSNHDLDKSLNDSTLLRILIPYQNSLYIQDGVPVWNRVSCAADTNISEEQILAYCNNNYYQDVPSWEPCPARWWPIYNLGKNMRSLDDSSSPQRETRLSRDIDPVDNLSMTLEEESSPAIPRKRLYPESEHDSIPSRKKVENNQLEHPDKTPMDPQLSPDGSMVAFVISGDLYVVSCHSMNKSQRNMKDSEEDVVKKFQYTSQDEEDQEAPYPIQITFGATIEDTVISNRYDESRRSSMILEDIPSKVRKKRYGRAITHGLADYVAQEEMERYHGFWWSPDSKGILFTRVDESYIPPFRIMHHSFEDHAPLRSKMQSDFEEHRYPFAGEVNAQVTLGYVEIDSEMLLGNNFKHLNKEELQKKARANFDRVKWFDPPDDASEYLAAVNWLQESKVVVQWQNRAQTKLQFVLLNVNTGQLFSLCKETSDSWINLSHIFELLPRTVNPDKYFGYATLDEIWSDSPAGAFSFMISSERTGYCHIYLYTYIPGDESATLIRPVTAGNWIVESIDGIDMDSNVVYVSGTYDSALEKHLYAVALLGPDVDTQSKVIRGDESRVRNNFWQVFGALGSAAQVNEPHSTMSIPRVPLRLTQGFGMHNVILDSTCRLVVDTWSDLSEPTSTRLFYLPPPSHFQLSAAKFNSDSPWMLHQLWTLHDSLFEMAQDKSDDYNIALSPPEIIPFASSDPSRTLYAALYRPDPLAHGRGPYPLICSVYGGPRVQRVNRSWNQTIDLRAQHLCSLGFAVVKCDNHGSSRRGKVFETTIKGQLGHVEVRDQVLCVQMLIMRGVADPSRVGIYGWSYGGYLAAMCLCRQPDVFQVAVSGAPVTNWLGYDTHYTERYLGLPSENEEGYRKSSISEEVQNMKGRLLLIHGLIDENVHWRHSANLINQLTAAGKSYDLCVFPDERHSPRRLKNRIYLERKISDFFLEHLRKSDISVGTQNSSDAKPVGRL